MYYDDQVRRFNFLSGLLMGLLVGMGLALVGRPHASRLSPGAVRRRAGRR